MRLAALSLMTLLVGCTAYPDDCNRRALHERRVVESLIRETQANLNRGYRYEIVQSNWNAGFVWCSGSGRNYNVALCTGNTAPSYRRVPMAIDPEVERRKLASLVERQKVLAAATAQCVPL